MEGIVVRCGWGLCPALKEEMIKWDYDKEADLMVIHFGKQKPGIPHEVEEGMLLRKDSSSGKWSGLTIKDFSKRCNKEK